MSLFSGEIATKVLRFWEIWHITVGQLPAEKARYLVELKK